MLRSPTTGTSRAPATSTPMGRATFCGATTAGRSISGRWMAWGSKRKGPRRTLRSPTIGTSSASATSTATPTATSYGATTAVRSTSGRWMGWGPKRRGGVAHAAVPNDWQIQGIGDFNNDGNSDILWRHDSGQVYIWEMDGLGIKAEGAVPHAPVSSDWHILS